MSNLYDDLKTGLQEAIDYERGNTKARTVTYVIMPVRSYSNKEIKRIRNNAGMTQKTFASYMGVSQKTVEAWELGRTHPTGPACRLLSILETNKQDNFDFVSVKITN